MSDYEATQRPLLEIDDLRVALTDGTEIVHGVSVAVHRGEIVAIVGESGSGKTTIGTCILGYLRSGAMVTGGSVRVLGDDVLAMDAQALQQLRGQVVAFVSQDPSSALSPSRRIGSQLSELIRQHDKGIGKHDLHARIVETLTAVGLPSTKEFLRRYPHQLSGGQLQRVVLGLAFSLTPAIIVLDEPTTGLDVTTQAKVLDTVRTLCVTHGVAAVYVSHDLSVVRELASRVIVLESGNIVEDRETAQLFAAPAHQYTARLLGSIPDVSERRLLDSAAPEPDSELTDCLRVTQLNCFYGAKQVLSDVSLVVPAGECVALVGESGSGKTTLSRSIVGLTSGWTGSITYSGSQLSTTARSRRPAERREVQYIFQSADRALNPRLTVMENVLVPIRHFFGLNGAAARAAAAEAFDKVALPSRLWDSRPRELSGGERQRAAIARAIACKPRLLICDEVTSALDVSVQAVILKLLDRLRVEEQLSMLFVTHNLAVVREIAGHVVVLKNGEVVESGRVDQVFSSPAAGYTRQLLADTPSLLRAVPALSPPRDVASMESSPMYERKRG